jgi:hypothetical protein
MPAEPVRRSPYRGSSRGVSRSVRTRPAVKGSSVRPVRKGVNPNAPRVTIVVKYRKPSRPAGTAAGGRHEQGHCPRSPRTSRGDGHQQHQDARRGQCGSEAVKPSSRPIWGKRDVHDHRVDDQHELHREQDQGAEGRGTRLMWTVVRSVQNPEPGHGSRTACRTVSQAMVVPPCAHSRALGRTERHPRASRVAATPRPGARSIPSVLELPPGLVGRVHAAMAPPSTGRMAPWT